VIRIFLMFFLKGRKRPLFIQGLQMNQEAAERRRIFLAQ